MNRLIWYFLFVALVAAAVALAAGPDSAIDLHWNGAAYRTTPGIAAAAIVIAMGVLLLLWQLLATLFNLPGAMGGWRRERRSRSNSLTLARGMVAVSAGDAKEARRHLALVRPTGESPLLAQLLAAQVAQLEGDEDGAARAYAEMLSRPETEFLGLRGLFLQALRRGDMTAAGRHAARAYELRPKTPWVALALFDLDVQARDWPAAERVLDTQAQGKLLPPDVIKRRRAVLQAATAQTLHETRNEDAALEKAQAALKVAPGLLPAALVAADVFVRRGRPKRAATILETAWTAAPHPDLAAAYIALGPDGMRSRALKLVDLNPNHPESRLLAAADAAQAKRYGEAESALAGLTTRHSARAARLMADIATVRGDTDGARRWSDRALRAPRDGVWRCEACSHEAYGWTPGCAQCGAFDTLTWTAPGDARGIAAAGDESADRMLYRLAPPKPAAAPAAIPEDVTVILSKPGEPPRPSRPDGG